MIKKFFISIAIGLFVFILVACTSNNHLVILNDAHENIIDQIPDEIAGDLLLPDLSYSYVDIAYETDDIEIFNHVLVYPFPETDQDIDLTITLTYQNTTISNTISRTVLSYDHLPKVPEIHIHTTNNAEITSKDEYLTGTLELREFNEDLEESILLEDEGIQIRLRGNSTFHMPKKSYKIKFDKKTALLSDYKEKDWVLLANYTDQTLIRNYLAFEMSRRMDMAFTPGATFVDVYVNDEYQGNYLLTDQVEATNDRVDIEENSSALDTGYLLELDNRLYTKDPDEIDENYFIIFGYYFIIKTPDWDDPEYSIDQFYFIEDYINTLYHTLEDGEDYTHLIDEQSFVDWFIVNEVFNNVDGGYSSVYLYKDKGEKLHMGPVWDFDLSTGNPGHLDETLRGPEGWYISLFEKNKFYYFLMNHESFREALKERWQEIYEDIILPVLDDIYQISYEITRSRYDNFERWDIIGTNQAWYTAPEILEQDTYQGQIWFLYDYMSTRLTWLNEEINNL